MTNDQPRLRKPSRLRLVDDVLHSLEDAILSGEAQPGSRLIEDAIAKQLSVSRTTVREALLMLERRGLVVSRPRGGTFVTRISRADALDLGYTRALLESYAVTVGFERITDAVLSQMDALIVDMGECRLPNELPRLLRIDIAFHRKLVECAEMPRLLELWSSLDGQLGSLYIRAIERDVPAIDFVVSFHAELLVALRSGDPSEARKAVLDHYVRFNDPTLSRATALDQAIETLVAAGR
ncbi:MAG: GntR family transcriptional regulator [Chloroflexota bacterium]|nr:GntR family transcriptional regulator [Chloroflexota bacterium]